MEPTHFANGQKVYEHQGDTLIYYYRDGTIKAKGPVKNATKDGLWQYFRKSGHLWKEGSYKAGKRDGLWEQFSPEGQVEVEIRYALGKTQ
jgi:antitoxin component YwqK of YwqJK toxin-antitoxin module